MQRKGRKNSGGGGGGSSGNWEAAVNELAPAYPPAFSGTLASAPLPYYDVHCNVAATIDYARQGRGKAKISLKTAVAEYRAALFMASGLQAMISHTVLLKPGRPWTEPVEDILGTKDEDDDDDDQGCPVRLYYVLGLTSAFNCSDKAQCNEATQAMVETIQSHAEQTIAVGSSLDFRPETVSQSGLDAQSQLHRLAATWRAAGLAKVPWQLHLLPGAASLVDSDSVAGTAYAKVLLDAQAQLAAAIDAYPDLRVHVVGWSGKATHMMALLQAFPRNICALGLDGTVTFAKAADLHECAFDIPLDRLVLETSTVIPSQVNQKLGRHAFFHSGCWPFVAQSVAEHKKTVAVEQVVQAANENALALYPQLASPTREAQVEQENCVK